MAFEAGENHEAKGEGRKRIQPEEHVAKAAEGAGLRLDALYLNEQEFTKTARTRGMQNNRQGANTNRIVLLRKD